MKQTILAFIAFMMFSMAVSASKTTNHFQPGPNEKVKVLNQYVNFINESIHGLLIVDKLLESYNLDINKYVDLESPKINQYTNKDLPKDIFEDTEHWFYEVSPYEWYRKASDGSKSLSDGSFVAIQTNADKMLSLIKAINQLRFEMDEVTIDKDLNIKDNLSKVYEKLEKGVSLYQEFYKVQGEMEKALNTSYNAIRPEISDAENAAIYKSITDLYRSSKVLVSKLREKDTDTFDQLIDLQTRSLDKAKALDISAFKSTKVNTGKFTFMWNNLLKTSAELNEVARNFFYQGDVPANYKLYGKFYYYYNVSAISKFNRYGSAMVFDINNIMDYLDLPTLKYTETPHYFQVIYPKKLDTLNVIQASDDFLTNIPTVLKERQVTLNNRIRVDNDVIDILLYDHMIEDGDIVSINFNGDWIIENEALEKGAKRIKLKLNKDGKNFLLLHAVSVGKRPPNTMAFSYMYHGEKKEVIMKSDLNSSELIEIILDK